MGVLFASQLTQYHVARRPFLNTPSSPIEVILVVKQLHMLGSTQVKSAWLHLDGLWGIILCLYVLP